ncbi:VanZ family protein [Rufibacter sp. LB8]|uniref:VanZ family protein n=1 Tax=Rufibacter sp. LB8 TaxID=2777781 RepID=UPI00178C7519
MRFLTYAPALGWAVLILIGTLLPAQALPSAPQWELLTFDSLVHAVLFGGQLLLALYALRKDRNLTSLSFTVAFLLVVLFGGLVEVLQGSMGYGRSADIGDAISNTVGCLLGLVLWFAVVRRF